VGTEEVPAPRRRNPRGAGEQLRGELIDAGIRVLAGHGDTERLSVRAVAAEAGVSAPAVYQHFPDRRGLVRAVVESCFDRFVARLDEAERDAADPFVALRLRCRAYVGVGLEEPHIYRVMFGAWSAGPKELNSYGRGPHAGAGAFTGLIADIQRCLNAGARTRRPAPFLAFQLWSLLHGMVDLRAGKPEMPWPGNAEMIDNLLACLGLGGRPRPAAAS
jgi:AcrR family transcriptional regulator